jgi:hypothetical protein
MTADVFGGESGQGNAASRAFALIYSGGLIWVQKSLGEQ